ncbi:MAG: hypothetical protein CL607_11365 [Anaerolineaceae bacterium]|nr:hypothetical protein [Anaerolineaceae bacterium]
MKSRMGTVEREFQSLIEEGALVGLAFAIIQAGDIVYSTGMGLTGVEDYSLPVTPDTLFPIGSITKSVAAATIMRLVEQQILDLDRPIVAYLDGFEFEDKANGQQVTLRHLLSHSSGLPAAGRNWGLRGRDALRKFIWEDVRNHRFVAPPGKVHIYANTAISCVAYVAEAVTGTPFDTLVKQLIFDPLDMKRSTFSHAEAMTYPTALPHLLTADGTLRVMHRHSDNDMGHASSFCFCSTRDLATFAAALLAPGTLFDEATLRDMQTPVISLHSSGANYPGALMTSAYGLGLQIGEYRGQRLVHHGGRNLSFNCFLELFPDQQMAVVLQTNYMSDERGVNALFALFDELLQPTVPLRPPVPKTLPYKAQEKLAGEYLNPRDGIRTISINSNGLLLDDKYPLIRIGKTQYFYRSDALRFAVAFSFDDMLVVRGIPYRRLHREHFDPDYERWQSYTGVFVDPFTPYPEETAIPVHFEDNQIWINNVPQEALSNNRFVSSDGLYVFLSDDRLQVHMGTCYVRPDQTPT